MTQFSLAELFGMTIRESANDGSDFTNPSADYRRLFLGEDGGLHLRDSAGAMTHIAAGEGTTLPASPPTGSRFFRSDLSLECVYDGTRWVTSTLYQLAIPFADAVPPITATGTNHRVALPLLSTYTPRVYDFWAGFFVVGGTALGASHKWVCDFKGGPSGTVYGTININSGASSVWRSSGAVAVNTSIAVTDFELEVLSTKTGTPGNLYLAPMISYRLVIT